MSENIYLADLSGKPFKWKANGPDAYDCWGLCREVYKRRGIILPEYFYDTSVVFLHEFFKNIKRDYISLEKPEPWCFIALMIYPPYTSHFGVVLENRYQFIHIMKDISVTIERFDTVDWKDKITGFYHYGRTQINQNS